MYVNNFGEEEMTFFNILFYFLFYLALTLAMERDGSSGGVIRLTVIDKDGVSRTMIPGDKHWTGYWRE